jgi:hypothetical protein
MTLSIGLFEPLQQLSPDFDIASVNKDISSRDMISKTTGLIKISSRSNSPKNKNSY